VGCVSLSRGGGGDRRTMCGLSGRVETVLEPRKKSVGALKPGRMLRVERANVLDSIVVKLQLNQLHKCNRSSRFKTSIAGVAQMKLPFAHPTTTMTNT
jgi:hypothetical protein